MGLFVPERPAYVPLPSPVTTRDTVIAVTAASIIAGVAMVASEPPNPHNDSPDLTAGLGDRAPEAGIMTSASSSNLRDWRSMLEQYGLNVFRIG